MHLCRHNARDKNKQKQEIAETAGWGSTKAGSKSPHLHVVVSELQHPPGRFSHHRERLLDDVVEALPFRKPVAELLRLVPATESIIHPIDATPSHPVPSHHLISAFRFFVAVWIGTLRFNKLLCNRYARKANSSRLEY